MRRHKISLLSPFLRPRRLLPLCLLSVVIAASAAAQNPPLSEQLELRGISRIDGVFEFSIYNKERKRSEWLRPHEPLEGYEILDYDFEKRYVRIRFGNQIGQIILHEAQVAPYVASAPEPTPPPPATMVKPSYPPPVPPPPSTVTSRPGPANRSANGLQNDRGSSNSGSTPPAMTGGSFRGVRPPSDGNPPTDPTNPPPSNGGDTPGDPGFDTPPPPPPSPPPSYTPSA